MGGSGGRAVLEVGAGTGLLGLSVAAAAEARGGGGERTSLILTDFDGHHVAGDGEGGAGDERDTVMSNLAYNAWLNGRCRDGAPASSPAVTVQTLDWGAPDRPLAWQLAPGSGPVGPSAAPRWAPPQPAEVRPADVVLGTEALGLEERDRVTGDPFASALVGPSSRGHRKRPLNSSDRGCRSIMG